MKISMEKLIANKYLLWTVFGLTIVNVLGYLAIQDYNSLALFVVIGLLSTYFSKNMSINLLVAILVTSIVAVNSKVQEGFEEKMKEGVGDGVQSQLKKVMLNLDKTVDKAVDKASKKGKCDPACDGGKVFNDDGKCVKKAGFQNNVPPSSPAPVNDDSDESVGDRIDYAATMEQAYNNLHKMLGEDGMNSITSETKKLVSQQKDLMGTLNQMAPILNNAKETLSGLNLGDMGDMSKMLKNLQGGAPPKMVK
jgi:hypothetical protein